MYNNGSNQFNPQQIDKHLLFFFFFLEYLVSIDTDTEGSNPTD